MRKFLACIIVALAHIVTFPLSPLRRTFVRIKVRDRLANVLPVATRHGGLVFFGENWESSTFILKSLGKGTDEPETEAWIDAMPEDACFWDIGANIGLFSLYAALRAGGGHIVAFEPAAVNYALLNRNIEANGMDHRVSAYCIALAEWTRLDVLNMAKTHAGTALHGFGTQEDHYLRPIATKFHQGAIGFSVDGFVELFSPPLPTHVKIDVDGLEPDILRGGAKTFSAPSVQSMIVEMEGSDERQAGIVALMVELGFTAVPKSSPGDRNMVFRRPE